jgi:transposase-like protein
MIMVELEQFACDNKACKLYGLLNIGNIAVRARYGGNTKHTLLYCKNCGSTFTPTQKSPLYKAHLPPETIRDIVSLSSHGMGVRGIAEHLRISTKAVNRNIIKVGEHCAELLSNMIVSLQLPEIQLDEFWSFVKKNALKRVEKYLKAMKVKSGSGQQ